MDEHLQNLEKAFIRLRQYNLKMNLDKSFFGQRETKYLGYVINEHGITIDKEKIKSIVDFPIPDTRKKIKSFVGVCNYFRRLIPGFSYLSGELSKLTKASEKWRGGVLPPAALSAFEELKKRLCTKPVLSFPKRDTPYILRTDACMGNEKQCGGLGACLMQFDEEKACQRVIAYASRGLKKHELNYSATNLELAAAAWAIDFFHVYLADTQFKLVVDAKPLTAPSTGQNKKTMHRLQEQMSEYNFEILYAPGPSNVVADALSRAQVAAIDLNSTKLQAMQKQDEFCAEMTTFIKSNKLPEIQNRAKFVAGHGRFCFEKDNILYIILSTKQNNRHAVPIIPKLLHGHMLGKAHDHVLSGHLAVEKTYARLLSVAWWPGMASDVKTYVTKCEICLESKNPPKFNERNLPLKSLDIPPAPGHTLVFDLFGALPVSQGCRWILGIIDCFSRYATFIPLPDKRAETVADAFFATMFVYMVHITDRFMTEGWSLSQRFQRNSIILCRL